MEIQINCLGISSLYHDRNKIYGNILSDVDDYGKNLNELETILQKIANKKRIDFIIVKSNNKKSGCHLVSPNIRNIKELLKLDRCIRYSLNKHNITVDSIKLSKMRKGYYSYLNDKNKNHIIGNVLRIGAKNGIDVSVYKVIYTNNPIKKSYIASDLIDIYTSKGLNMIDKMILKSRYSLKLIKNRVHIYPTMGSI